jgi:hypothetical protein
MNFDFKDKHALDAFKTDFNMLKMRLKHNPYDPCESDEQRLKRTQMFEDLMAKHS